MQKETISYTSTEGGTIAYGKVSWEKNDSSTVTVSIQLDYCYGLGWRIKKQGYSGNTGVVAEGASGQLTGSFTGTNGQTYVFQVNEGDNMMNDGNGVFTVDTSSSSGGDSGDDDDDDGGSGGGSSVGSYYFYIHECEGANVTVTRTFKQNASPSYDYYGELVDGTEEWYDGLRWYKYKIWDLDGFDIDVRPVSGYTLDTYVIDGNTFNFDIDGPLYYNGGASYEWLFNTASGAEDLWLYTSATKNSSGGDDSGGDDSGNSGSSSGDGTLYFNATQYGAQYAVEYHYNNNTFYIDSVKVKLAQYASVWWGFNLTTKINDTVISSGSENHFIDTFDWYDLGISGSAPVTSEVEVSLSGSAIHNSYQFNVSSPTTQTVNTGNSGSGGNSGGDSGGDDGESTTTKTDDAVASGITAEASWTTGPEVTVRITSWGGYNAGVPWKLVGRRSQGDNNTYIPETTASSATFNQTVTKREYTLQVCPSGTWTNDIGEASILTVDFGSSGSGGDDGSGGVTSVPRTLYLEQGKGTKLTVYVLSSDYYDHWEDFDGNTSITVNGKETVRIVSEALDGYELDYYDYSNYQLGYIIENLEYCKTDSTDPSIIYFRLANDDDARITTTATPIATVRMYNESVSDWDRYSIFVYNENFGWERYTPFIYNEKSLSWDRYN